MALTPGFHNDFLLSPELLPQDTSHRNVVYSNQTLSRIQYSTVSTIPLLVELFIVSPIFGQGVGLISVDPTFSIENSPSPCLSLSPMEKPRSKTMKKVVLKKKKEKQC